MADNLFTARQNLAEEAMVNVEEDYQVCARMLARKASEPKRRGTRKAEE